MADLRVREKQNKHNQLLFGSDGTGGVLSFSRVPCD
jgi:hypothetical protein